jgi:4-amino-4-deoxy-L-arabinose transferase-like glycosyltransferase
LVRWLWLAQGQIAAGTSALRVAQWVNAIAGAGAVTFVYLSLRRICGTSVAAASALLLGFTGVVARHAIEGEVHTLPLCCLALALWLLVRGPADAKAGVGVGLAAAAAILMHQTYVVFLPAVLGGFFVRSARRTTTLVVLLCAAVPCAVTYAIVFTRTGLGWGELHRWLLHEAGIVGWRQDSLPNTGRALLNALSPRGNRTPPWRIDTVLPAGVLLGLAIQGIRKCRSETAPLLWFSALAAGVGLPAIAWHQPDFQYFCPIALAAMLPAALGLGSLPRRRTVPLAWALATLNAVATCSFLLRPAHDAATNDALGRAQFVAAHTSKRAVVLSTGTGAATCDLQYLPYFAKTKAVTLWQARSRFGDAGLVAGLRTLLDEAGARKGRILAFADLVTPGKSFRGFLDTPIPLGGGEIRAALAEDYEFVDVAVYVGTGYEEGLLELRPRGLVPAAEGGACGLGCPFGHECVEGLCRCGPARHFQLRAGRCLPSCGVLLDQQAERPESSACCDRPCSSVAVLATAFEETWDCQYCCGGTKGQALCGELPP